MKQICIITTAHPAEDNRIFLKEIATLLPHYRVTYITTAKVKKTDKNLTVLDMDYSPVGFIKRIKSDFKAFRMALLQNVESYHFHDFDFIFWAVLLCLLKRKPVIYDVHEDYPAVVLSRDYVKGNFLIKLLSAIVKISEMFCAMFFKGAITVNSTIKKRLGKVVKNTIVVANYPSKEYFSKSVNYPDKHTTKTIVHLGNLNKIRGAEIIFKALNNIKRVKPRLKVIGEITPKEYFVDLKERYSDVVVTVTGNLPYNRALSEAQSGDIGIIGYLPLPNHQEASPNKIFEYMGLGLPVVASDLPSFQEVIAKGAGVTYRSEDADDLTAKLKLLDNAKKLNSFSQKGRLLFETEYNWSAEAGKLLELYEKIIGK